MQYPTRQVVQGIPHGTSQRLVRVSTRCSDDEAAGLGAAGGETPPVWAELVHEPLSPDAEADQVPPWVLSTRSRACRSACNHWGGRCESASESASLVGGLPGACPMITTPLWRQIKRRHAAQARTPECTSTLRSASRRRGEQEPPPQREHDRKCHNSPTPCTGMRHDANSQNPAQRPQACPALLRC